MNGHSTRRYAVELAGPDHAGGARHRHKLETLAALRHAALHLALERGVDAITVNDIAGAAGVSRRTFFNYFASKEDALVGETPQLSAFLRQALADRPAHESPLTAVERALLETYRVFVTEDIRDRIRARHRLLAAYPQLLPRHLTRYAAFEQLLEDALTARATSHPEHQADPGLLATLLASTVRHCAHRWAEDGDPPLVQRLTAAFTALRHGLH